MAGPLSGEQAEERLEEAVKAAEEAATRVLSRFLGPYTGLYNVIVSVEERQGETRLIVDIAVSRPRASRKMLGEIIDAAIDAARTAFEEVYGVGHGSRGKTKRIRQRSRDNPP